MSLPVRAVSAISILAEPITFRNGKKAPNRIMKSPLTEKLYDWTDPSISKRGNPSQAIKNIYSTWGHGGFGLIVTGMFVVDPKYISEAGQGIICEENSAHNQELSVLSKALKSSESLAIAQLSHPGSKAITDYTDSTDEKHVINDNVQDSITYTQQQLEEKVLSRFAFAASELYKNGFDGIELLAAHGGIFNQFLSSGNQRDDDYSGSLENRARLLFDVLNAVRRAVPESTGFLVGVKLNSRDFQGSEEEKKDVIRLCELIEEAGFDFVELTGGMMEMTMPALQLRDSTVTRENYFAEFITETSRIFEKTVIYITGGWQTADSMASSVELGLTNGVGLARWSAAEPDFPKKLLAGEITGLTPNGFPRFDFWYHKNAALWQLRSMAESSKGIPTDFTRPLECEKFAKACDEYKVKVEKIGGINNHVGVMDYAPL